MQSEARLSSSSNAPVSMAKMETGEPSLSSSLRFRLRLRLQNAALNEAALGRATGGGAPVAPHGEGGPEVEESAGHASSANAALGEGGREPNIHSVNRDGDRAGRIVLSSVRATATIDGRVAGT